MSIVISTNSNMTCDNIGQLTLSLEYSKVNGMCCIMVFVSDFKFKLINIYLILNFLS